MDDWAIKTKYPNLKRQAQAGANLLEPWTKENIMVGFNKFFDENNRYPTAEEIDDYEYLPSSRQIQRAFGGLKNLRKILGLPVTDFGSGKNRSVIAYFINKRGIKGEREIEEILTDHFGEYFVHIEKPLYKYFPEGTSFKNKIRADFFVYHKEGHFAVDVFFAKGKKQLNIILNTKAKHYSHINIKTYFVLLSEGEGFTDDVIEHVLNAKILKLDQNIKSLTKRAFIKEINTFKPLTMT